MLVVTRRAGEQIVFPGFSAAVRVVAVKANAVRLGIEAPPEVAVYRDELLPLPRLAALGPTGDPSGPDPKPDPREVRHRLRNRLNAAAIGLALLQRQQQAGLAADAEATLARVNEEIEALRGCLDGLTDPPPGPAARPAKVHRALLLSPVPAMHP